MSATVGAAFTVKCFKLFHRVPAADPFSIESLALLARVDASLCCFVWYFGVLLNFIVIFHFHLSSYSPVLMTIIKV